MFQHLDLIDQEVISAIQAGKTNEEIIAELGVTEDKILSMKGHLANTEEPVNSEETLDTTDDSSLDDEIEPTGSEEITELADAPSAPQEEVDTDLPTGTV